ncbi:response regulator transcription factor [Pedobacter metabolipauper]|uniref:LuxR family two component transcriptional regulator n=1 Tax=Pedobacter metabolipauper TaxID=425513 RepID=A0A4R6T084_9SPHI|nr:response regulator transcription factor [Pedobacter metabolipauper]TDQ11802.1 LuxR family two component transcriptional regulator [Pedobacter metabolipauper]
MPKEKIHIAIAEDQHLFRESLHALLSIQVNIRILLEEDNGKTFLEKIKAMELLPDIALIDINMPGLNGMELTEILRSDFPAIKVIILSVYKQDRLIAKMINSGACAYLNKNCDAAELFTAIDSVHKNGFYMTGEVLHAIRQTTSQTIKKIKGFNAVLEELTKREKEILELICKEYNSAEIADKLYLSIRTVEGHRNNLLLKTNSKNTAGLVMFALKHDLFQLLL